MAVSFSRPYRYAANWRCRLSSGCCSRGDTRGILRRRAGEIDRAGELKRLGLESAGERELSRYYYLADYEYFLDRINPEGHRYILRDKGVLLRRLAAGPQDFLKRPWTDLRRCPPSAFEAFLAGVDSSAPIVAKRFDGHRSNGLELVDVETGSGRQSDRRGPVEGSIVRLIENKQYIVEGFIAQHAEMARFYRPAVASLRIFTLNLGGDVSVVFRPSVSFGSRGQRTNNPTSIQAFFDPRSGLILTDGIGQGSRKYGERGVIFTRHPDTHEPFKGGTIPFAAEAVQMAKDAAKLVPELPFVGWDIAIAPDGPVVIEGNAAPMLVYGWQEMHGALLGERGMRREFEQVFARFERFERQAKRRGSAVIAPTALPQVICPLDEPVSAEAVAQANAALFAPDPTSEELADVRICVVLGSANCTYRAERAAAAFAGRSDVVFVACGGPATASGLTEARLIARTLADFGIPDDRIIVEELSSNTRENLAEAERLVIGPVGAESGVMHGVIGDGQIAIVSAGFHRRRVLQCLPPAFAGAVFINALVHAPAPTPGICRPTGARVIGDELAALSASEGVG